MMVNIIEIISRSTQGITRPFICRGDDGLFYYVKGHGAGRKALIAEWIAGSLGKRLGLPIPDFKLAVMPDDLTRLSARDDIADLGAGIGFASQRISNTDELTYLYIGQIDEVLRARILLFDWRTANGDRTLTEHGGNPNILWVHHDHKPYVIDHNLAFEQSALPDFWSQHIFLESRATWTPAFRQSMESLMRAALRELENLWSEMPPGWTDTPSDITFESVKKMLWRFDAESAKFWEAE
jgi:hypothetical protein